jgi:4-alpha-glucanotransferase
VSGSLRQLADLCGVLTSYVGVDRRTRVIEPDVARSVLGALGVSAGNDREVASSIADVRSRRAGVVIEPVLTHRFTGSDAISVRLPKGIAPGATWITVRPDGGKPCRRRVSDVAREPRSVGREAGDPIQSGAERHQRFDVELERVVPELAPGYHRVEVEAPGMEASALLIAAPACPRPRRGWGVFLPLHALRTEHDWGIGSYPDLGELVRWTSRAGGSMVGTLPLYPVLLEDPVDPSPYRPASRLAYNELFVDPTVQPEFALDRRARALLESVAFVRQLEAARDRVLVDYAAAARCRRAVLEPMAELLHDGDSPRRRALETFAVANPHIVAYAQFRAAGEVGRRWSRDDPEPSSERERRAVRYHLYGQWAAAEQLSAAHAISRSLYADLPVGVHPEGFDPAWCPTTFAMAAAGGAPPDGFNPHGQDWSFPPMHPEAIRSDGYSYFVASLRRAFAHAAFLRVDHVMGLHRLYWIPSGFDARHGAYVTYRNDELRAIVALEAYRVGGVVIGEDLGTVPDLVRRTMTEDRMLRSWVLQFEASADDPLPSPPQGVLASIGTHDLPRFTSFFLGREISEREAEGSLAPADADAERVRRRTWAEALRARVDGRGNVPGDFDDEPRTATTAHGDRRLADDLTERVARFAYERCVELLAASDADLLLIDLEEAWGEEEPQNRPGTSSTMPNWRRRARYTLAELDRCSGLRNLAERIGRARDGGARDGRGGAVA